MAKEREKYHLPFHARHPLIKDVHVPGGAAGSLFHGLVQSDLVQCPQATGCHRAVYSSSFGRRPVAAAVFLDSAYSRPLCRTRGSTGLWVARPHLSMGWLPPGPQSLFGKGTTPLEMGARALAADLEPSVQAGVRGAIQDHPGWEAGFICISQAGWSPRETLASLGYHHTLSCCENWWASLRRVATPTGRDPDTAQGCWGGGACWDNLRWPRPPAPGHMAPCLLPPSP